MSNNSQPAAELLAMPDAEVLLYRGFFSQAENDQLFRELADTIHWTQQSIKMPSGVVPVPRLVAWYGDEGIAYSYSGITLQPDVWTATLATIKKRVEAVTEHTFNSVLLNFYRNENDSVGWHSDDEPELGTNPIIASVSFGATRRFQFKHIQNKELRLSVDLTPGSLLVMRGTTQHFWKHQIPKTKQPHEPRINLTFRTIYKR